MFVKFDSSIEFEALIQENEPDTTILLADGSIPAHSQLLRLSCQAALKDDQLTPTWDLRNFDIEDGSPAQKETVLLWLQYVYPNYLSFRKAPTPSTYQAARPLLLFADAVGTTPALFHRIMVDIPTWNLELEHPFWAEETIKLPLNAKSVYKFHKDASASPTHADDVQVYDLREVSGGDQNGSASSRELCRPLSKHMIGILKLQVADQVEELLYLSHKAKFTELAQVLFQFLKLNIDEDDRLLSDNDLSAAVVSRRVANELDRKAVQQIRGLWGTWI